MNQEQARRAEQRRQYLRTHGFLLYTDTSTRMLEMAEAEPLRATDFSPLVVGYFENNEEVLTESQLALWATTNVLAKARILQVGASSAGHMLGATDTEMDKAEQHRVYNAGFADRSFPWHFSAALASAATWSFLEQGHISDRQLNRLTLADWAGFIASRGFRQLMHSFAFAPNGIYGTFGEGLADCEHWALGTRVRGQLAGYAGELFDSGYRREPEREWQLVARMHPSLRAAMRDQMRRTGSGGCPVARRSVRLAPRHKTNRHLRRLVDEGHLEIIAELDNGYIQVEQQQTAIDRTLLHIAGRLLRYDEQFGTPVLVREKGTNYVIDTRHARRKPIGALTRSTTPPRTRQLTSSKRSSGE